MKGVAEEGGARAEADRYRALERAWQDDVGYALLDKPYEAAGSEAVFVKQWDRLIARLDTAPDGVLIEIGCGKGHFLRHIRATMRGRRRLVGIDLSRAVLSLPPEGLDGARADGEWLPFRDASASCVLYDGALHHMIDYADALAEAIRVLAPGGLLVIFEPMTSRFSQLAHRILDPIIFRQVVYESPIDIRYKRDFHLDTIGAVLRRNGLTYDLTRSDFLAYPLTGCYAGSAFARRPRLMRTVMALEDAIEAVPGVRRLAQVFAWRFTIVARKPTAG